MLLTSLVLKIKKIFNCIWNPDLTNAAEHNPSCLINFCGWQKAKPQVRSWMLNSKISQKWVVQCRGCPKSSFLYFISLYFSKIGLGKQIIWRKAVCFNLIHYFHTDGAIFWIFDLCTSVPKVPVHVFFPSHVYFVYFITRIARTPSLFFCDYQER